jgi:hypothetical protein
MELAKTIESKGSESGAPSAQVKVERCAQLE